MDLFLTSTILEDISILAFDDAYLGLILDIPSFERSFPIEIS